MPAQWIASAPHNHTKDTIPGIPRCSWPIPIISHDRDLDLTECFELAVLQPAPLVLTIAIGLAQVIYTNRKLKKTGPGSIDWIHRPKNNERVAKIKVALFALATALAVASAGLSVTHICESPFEFIHFAFLALAYVVLGAVSWVNHHTSRTSSTLILLFFPLYLLVEVVCVRTAINTGGLSLDLSETLEGRLIIAREALALASVGIGFIAFFLELYTPEKKWVSWRAPWSSQGKIRLEEDEEQDTFDSQIPSEGKDEQEQESPFVTSNIYDRLTFSWLTPLLQLGTRKFLGEEDMWLLPPADSAEALSARLAKTWHRQLDLVKAGKKSSPSLKIAIAQAYGAPYLVAAFLKGFYDILSFTQPQLLRLLLTFVSSYGTDTPLPPSAGIFIAILMFTAANLATALLHQYFDRCFQTTMRVKTGLITLIYRKSLLISSGERSGRTSGDIVNLQSVDAVRIADIAQYGNIAWSGPFQIILAFVSLYNLVGWQAFMGVGVMLVSIPVNTYISRIQKSLQRKLMKTKDTRTRLMSEILNNIKSIKLYGWEQSFSDKIFNARNNMELKMLRRIGIVNAMSNFMWSSVPFLVAFATFSSFVFTADRPLTADIIFPAISLFTLLSFPMSVFSNIINSIIEALVSIQRIEDFLASPELDPTARKVILPSEDPQGEARVGDTVITIKDGEFSWASDQVEPTLQDINVTVKKGELLAVVGRVGAGKTSLLSAILGEMSRKEGSVTIRGDIAYFSQNSWIMSATVKDNIVFGHRFDPVFYDQVLDACALRADLAVLPDGHMTEVGEKGVSLSGGQKARICLARAVYARADIYLLDDPLSAVDAHVGKHIFESVIGPNGLLKNKARVFCTNAVNVLPKTDEIVMFRRGIIIEQTNYASAVADTSSELCKLITGLGQQSANGEETESGSVTPTIVASPSDSGDEADAVDDSDSIKKRRAERRASTATRRASVLSLRQAKREAIRDLRESAKPKEHIEKGQVKFEVYKQYLAAAGISGVLIFTSCIALSQASSMLSNWVLKDWGNLNSKYGQNMDVLKYLVLYGVLGFSSSLLSVSGILTLKLYLGLRAAKKLHDKAFKSLMRSPLSFFELTPTGRILNLFSRDIFVIDEVLPMALGQACRTLLQVLMVIILIAIGAPVVLIAFIPLAYIYRLIMRYYLATSRELKRLDAVSRSPIFSFFSETLSGLTVIRAYHQSGRFQANNEARVDRNQACYRPAMAINRWLAIRLEFLGSCLMFSTALASVIALLLTGNVDPGMVGILMSYTVSITGTLNWFVRTASEVEQNIVSVERILGYVNLPSEAPDEIPATAPAESWPQQGGIEFDHYAMRYRPELPLVLKDVCVNIQGGHRVGVVGRTGAGKSSLTLALFRILEASKGTILIDDIDIATIGLKNLRNVVSIIPQDPQLFEGSLRNNIDPTNKASDAALWLALEQAHLKDHVMRNMGGTLDAEISEGGSNLSSGQRQLVCFARALLRRTKILVLDEATSSIDLETDAAVQEILRGPDFAGVTTITIAHRINTIMDSDRVLVMSQGEVAEYDSPENLLKNPDSVFTSLVNESGLGAAAQAEAKEKERREEEEGDNSKGKDKSK